MFKITDTVMYKYIMWVKQQKNNHLGMVYTTNFWCFWGWFIVVLPTLCSLTGFPRCRMMVIAVLSPEWSDSVLPLQHAGTPWRAEAHTRFRQSLAKDGGREYSSILSGWLFGGLGHLK